MDKFRAAEWQYRPWDVRLNPRPAPTTGIFDEPRFRVCINGEWASHVDGVLGRLAHTDAWLGEDEEVQTAIEEVTKLLKALAVQEESCGDFDVPVLTNIQVVDCVIQAQYDGIDDWVTIGSVANCTPQTVVRDEGDGQLQQSFDGGETFEDVENAHYLHINADNDPLTGGLGITPATTSQEAVAINYATTPSVNPLTYRVGGAIKHLITPSGGFQVIDGSGYLLFHAASGFPRFQFSLDNAAHTIEQRQTVGNPDMAMDWAYDSVLRHRFYADRAKLYNELALWSNSSTQIRDMVFLRASWEISTDATRRGSMKIITRDNAGERTAIDVGTDGSAPTIAVLGATRSPRVALGSVNCGGNQAALDALEALKTFGYVSGTFTLGSGGGDGEDGQDGASVELRVSGDYIQWRQDDDDPTWTNLVALEDLEGPQGIQGIQGIPGEDGEQGEPGADGECPDCGNTPPDYDPPEETDGIKCSIAINEAKYVRGLWQKAYDDEDGILEGVFNGVITISTLLAYFFPGIAIAGVIAGLMAQILRGINDLESNEFDDDYEEKIRCDLFCILQAQGKTTIDADVITAWSAAVVEGANPYQELTAQLIANVPLSEFQWIAYASSEVNPEACDCDCDDDDTICEDNDLDLRITDASGTPEDGCITWIEGTGWNRPTVGCDAFYVYIPVGQNIDYVEVEFDLDGHTPIEICYGNTSPGGTFFGLGTPDEVDPKYGGNVRQRYTFSCQHIATVRVPIRSGGTPAQRVLVGFEVGCCTP